MRRNTRENCVEIRAMLPQLWRNFALTKANNNANKTTLQSIWYAAYTVREYGL